MLIEVTGTGVDDTVALQAAATSATAKDKIRLYGPCVTSRIFSPPCSWGGVSSVESQLIALAGSGTNLASISDRSGISVTDIGFVGEGLPNGTFGLAVGSPTTASTDQLIEGCSFSKLSANQWIVGGAAAPCNGLRIRKNHFNSTAADYPGTGGGGIFIYLQSGAGFFTNGEIDGNIMDGPGVSFGVTLFGNHIGFLITRNQINNIGLNVTVQPGFPGRYGITIYNTDATPINGITSDNLIINPAECGIYIANASEQTVTGNRIVGQYGNANISSLPRGAISLNGLNGGLIANNDLENFLWGIALSGGSPGTPPCANLSILANRLRDSINANAIALNADSAVFSTGANLTFAFNDINLDGGGSAAFGGSLTGNGNITVSQNTGHAAHIWGGAVYSGAVTNLNNPLLA